MRKKVYVYYQPNQKDLKDQYGDCVVRAICKVTNKEWLEVFDGLFQYARNYQCMPNQPSAYENYLRDNGFEYHPLKCRPRMQTVMEFRREYKGIAICNTKVGYGSHFVAVDNGQGFDTWDSTEQKMYGYWALK